jgi:hypothetical protein
MMSDQSQRKWPEGDDRKFYIQRGIPIIPTLTFLTAIGIQTVLGVRYISGLEAQLTAQGLSQRDMVVRVEKIETRIESIQTALNQGNVPAALNQRAISDLERQINNLLARLSELERGARDEPRRRYDR